MKLPCLMICGMALSAASFALAGPTTAPADATAHPATTPANPIVELQSRYIHRPSGIAVPKSLDGYVFVEAHQYNQQGTDVSFGWNMLDAEHPLAGTVYIFPAPGVISIGSPKEVVEEAKAHLFDRSWQEQVRSITGSHAGATASPSETVRLTYAGQTYIGRRQLFHYEQDFAGDRQQVTSSLYLFCFVNEQWSLKYRFTYRAATDMQPTVDRFMTLVPAGK